MHNYWDTQSYFTQLETREASPVLCTPRYV